jgi:hypothetical protein
MTTGWSDSSTLEATTLVLCANTPSQKMSHTLASGQPQQHDKKKPSSSVKNSTTTNTIDAQDDEDECTIEGIRFVDYVDESQLHHVMNLVGRDLSEPYSGKNVVSSGVIL